MILFDTEPKIKELDKFTGRLLSEWNGTLCGYENEYRRIWPDDCDLPYLYKEIPQVGLLAIAAREIGGFPLMEWGSLKKVVKGTPRRKGRQDLEIIYEDKIYWLEAKYCEPTIKLGPDYFMTKIRDSLAAAKEAVRERDGRAVKRLAITFVVPKSVRTDTQWKEEVKDKIRELVQRSPKYFAGFHHCNPSVLASAATYVKRPGIIIVGMYVN